jgi:hypothetical protein
MLIKYVRKSNKSIGCMVSDKIDGKVCIGWSLTNKRDRFDKKKSLEMAKTRLSLNDRYAGDYFIDEEFPLSLYKPMVKFLVRVKRYFKDSDRSLFVSNLIDYFDHEIEMECIKRAVFQSPKRKAVHDLEKEVFVEDETEPNDTSSDHIFKLAIALKINLKHNLKSDLYYIPSFNPSVSFTKYEVKAFLKGFEFAQPLPY